jgi:hypothetical protein
MTRKWFVPCLLLCAVVWFVLASYAFVILVGLHQCGCASRIVLGAIGVYGGDTGSATGFYDQLVAKGYQPWMAYWTYWNNITDPVDQYMYEDAAIAPTVLFALLGAIAYRIARGSRNRHRLVRWPWEDDSRRIP